MHRQPVPITARRGDRCGRQRRRARHPVQRRLGRHVAPARATPATRATVDAARRIGVDLSRHRSTPLDVRQRSRRRSRHRRWSAGTCRRSCWWRRGRSRETFTLKELVAAGQRRSARAGRTNRSPTWLARAHAGRRPTDLLGASPDDDVADPTGSALADHHGTAEEIDRLAGRRARRPAVRPRRCAEPTRSVGRRAVVGHEQLGVVVVAEPSPLPFAVRRGRVAFGAVDRRAAGPSTRPGW